eukprot:6325836-Karenia_brevis.AAC.1
MPSLAAEVGLDVTEQASIGNWSGTVADGSSHLRTVLGSMAVRYSDRRIQLAAQSKAKILHSLAYATKKVGSYERTVEDYKCHFLDKASLDKLTS